MGSKGETKGKHKNDEELTSAIKGKKWPLWPAYVLAGCLRFWLCTGPMGPMLGDRVELATPLNSYKRLVEGITLMENGVDPYTGALFHETPLALHLFAFVRHQLPPQFVPYLFVLSDLLAAFVLGSLARAFSRRLLKTQEEEIKDYHPDANELLVSNDVIGTSDVIAQLTYLFHPYLVANCAAKTTATFTNLLLVVFLWGCLRRHRAAGTGIACASLALLTYQQFYPVMLLFPLCAAAIGNSNDQAAVKVAAKVTATFLAFFAGLNVASYHAMGGSWNFLHSTHGFILSVPELSPNIGLFWYFFTEMFEHFRLFFVWTFQLNCFIYVLPLTVKLHRRQPLLLAWTLVALTAVFKSYPCYGDVGLYLALLPVLGHLFPYMKQTFIAGNMFVAATVLGPMMHQMWIYNGSANSNYFFAINLVFGVAQILLISDLLFAHIKREYYLKNGFKDLQPDPDQPNKGKRLIFK